MKRERLIGKKLIVLDSIDSTNNYLSKFINETIVLNGTVILAHNQTKGRGQRGNHWESEEGKNLTFSIYLKTDFLNLSQSFLLSMVVCNSIHELVARYTDKAKIKWPNDVLIDGKKISGILIENSLHQTSLNNSIIGIGLNVNQESFSKKNPAISLIQFTNQALNKEEVLAEFCSIFDRNFLELEQGHFLKAKNYYFSNLIGYRTELDYKWTNNNEAFKGEILSVEDNGLLKMLINRKNTKSIEMKEIKLIPGKK